MAFEHSARALTNWLRSINAARSPNQQVVGQEIEDNLRAVVQVADWRYMTPPTILAAFCIRIFEVGAIAGENNVEEWRTRSPADGGLGIWVTALNLGAGRNVFEVAEAASTAIAAPIDRNPDLVPIGTEPTAETNVVAGIEVPAVGAASDEAPSFGAFFNLPTQFPPIFVPPGKVFRILPLGNAQNLICDYASFIEPRRQPPA